MNRSRRTSPLPPNWRSIRAAILKRDPTCRLRTHCDGAPSTEVDHIGHPDDHTPGSLRGVCRRCHASRTGKQAASARSTKYDRRRPVERHPGLIDGT